MKVHNVAVLTIVVWREGGKIGTFFWGEAPTSGLCEGGGRAGGKRSSSSSKAELEEVSSST